MIFTGCVTFCGYEEAFEKDTMKKDYEDMCARYERQIFRVTLLPKILGLDPKLDELKTMKEGEPA